MDIIQKYNSRNVIQKAGNRNQAIVEPSTTLYPRLSGDTPDFLWTMDLYLSRIHSGVTPENSKIPPRYRRTDPICSLSGDAPDFLWATELWSGRIYSGVTPGNSEIRCYIKEQI